MQQAFLLWKLSNALRNKIDVTDDIDDFDHVLVHLDMAIESQFAKLLETTDIPMQEIFAHEQKLIALDSQFDFYRNRSTWKLISTIKVTTHPFPHTADRKEPIGWRREDYIRGLPW
ncbi:MAG: hypothetical protein ACYDBH_22025, partial [Acidobacteriaceae bacterium]